MVLRSHGDSDFFDGTGRPDLPAHGTGVRLPDVGLHVPWQGEGGAFSCSRGGEEEEAGGAGGGKKEEEEDRVGVESSVVLLRVWQFFGECRYGFGPVFCGPASFVDLYLEIPGV